MFSPMLSDFGRLAGVARQQAESSRRPLRFFERTTLGCFGRLTAGTDSDVLLSRVLFEDVFDVRPRTELRRVLATVSGSERD